MRLRAKRGQAFGSPVQALFVDIGDRQTGPAPRQADRQFSADARAGAGDNRDLAFKRTHVRLPLAAVSYASMSKRLGLPAEAEREVRPQGGVVAVSVQVPAGAAAGHPHRSTEFALQFIVVGVLGIRADVDATDAATLHGGDGVHDVVDLGFDHVHHRGVAQS